jgi:branched-chain amino acid transport system substrate-binding protein
VRAPPFKFAIAVIAFIFFGAAADGKNGLVKIGAIYNLTGGQQNLDIPSSQGARLAVDLINAEGGVLGQQVNLTVADGETKPDVIARQTERLLEAEPHIAGLIGLSDTDMVLAAANVAAKHGRVFLTSGATSPLLPEQVPTYLFLACFGDNVQAAAGAEWAYEALNARTAAVLFKRDSTYAQLLYKYFQTRFQELGGKVLAVEPYTLDADDIRSEVDKLPRADIVYLAAQPDDVALAVPALRNAGIDVPIVGGDGLDIGEAWADVDETRDVYFTTHAYLGDDNPSPEVKAFRTAFAKAFSGTTPDAFTALGYDAARLLIDAIGRAGGTSPDAVRRALAETKEFTGVTGTISFSNGSRIPSKSVTIMKVDGGEQIFAAEIRPKKVPAP